MNIDQKMMVRVRRHLHMHPELGWDLDETTAYVRQELDKIGVPYEFEKYGRNSIVATVNPQKSVFTIGIRADMDALPIQEKNEDKPYRSKYDGKMHACGHDAHTAMLVGTAKALYEMRDKIDCRVRLIFQPCEESRPSGASVLCESGIMRDIDCIIMCHVNCNDPCGAPSSRAGVTNATSGALKIVTRGKAVHIAAQHKGVDALAMGVRIYEGIQMLLSREADPFDTCVIAVATMHAGTTTATNADQCELGGSIRCLRDSTYAWARKRIEVIARSVCESMGGSCDVEIAENPLPVAVNSDVMYRAFAETCERALGAGSLLQLEPSPGGEDFAYYEREKPGLLFGLGMRNDELGFNQPAHTSAWDIDERGMENGVRLFVQFVSDHMGGIAGL
ncbi:MAG: amidohydrolase [Oscillospiraceae bacterium]|jgi:amidohydrolase|nr:amidohydrolase [Oscillospiraceae bacterium]